MSRLAFVKRFMTHMTAVLAFMVLAWVGVVQAVPPLTSGKPIPDEIKVKAQQDKGIKSPLPVNGIAFGKKPASRTSSSAFVQMREQKMRARELARIVRQAPEGLIRANLVEIILRYSSLVEENAQRVDSVTEGAGQQADTASLKSMHDQILKEMYEAERKKETERGESTREYIEKLIEQLKELEKLWARDFGYTLQVGK